MFCFQFFFTLFCVLNESYSVPQEKKSLDNIHFELSTNEENIFYLYQRSYFFSDDLSVVRINVGNEKDLPEWLSYQTYHKDDYDHILGVSKGRGFVLREYDEVLFVSSFFMGLRIFNISDLLNPYHIGYLDTSSFGADTMYENIYISPDEQYVYICETDSEYEYGNILVVNVTNPSTPQVVSTFNSGGSRDIFCEGYFCFAIPDEHLLFVDLTDPFNPKNLSYTQLPNCTNSLMIILQDELVFVSCEDSINIINVSNPLQPTYISKAETLDTRYICVDGMYLFASERTPYNNISVFNISTPSSPQLIRTFDPGVDFYTNQITCQGGILYCAFGDKGVYLYNVTDPETSFVYTDRINTDGWSVRLYLPDQLFQNKKLLFLGDGSDPTLIIDVTNPEDIQTISDLGDVDDDSNCISSNYDLRLTLPLLNKGGACLIDFSEDNELTLLNHWGFESSVIDAQIFEDYTYILDYRSLNIFDTRTFEMIYYKEIIGKSTMALFVDEEEELLYFGTTNSAYFVTVNITKNKTHPEFLKWVGGINNGIRDILVFESFGSEKWAVLAVMDGIQFVDVTNPKDPIDHPPFTVMETEFHGYLSFMDEEKTMLIVVSISVGFSVINVTDKLSPVLVYQSSPSMSARGARYLQNEKLLYVASYYDRIRVYNLSDPSNPTRIPDLEVIPPQYEDDVRDLEVFEQDPLRRILFLSDDQGFFRWNGLEVVEFTYPQNTPNHELPCGSFEISVNVTDDSGEIVSSFQLVLHREGFVDPFCTVVWCNGVMSNDSAVCDKHGNCTGYISDFTHKGYGLCHCEENSYGENCDTFFCFGFFSNETSEVCSGSEAGTCLFNGDCVCNNEYFGTICNITTCDGVYNNKTDEVCHGHGSCFPFEHCTCDENYFGDSCNVTTCYDVFSNESFSCGSHGFCDTYDTCICNFPNYYGSFCNITTCFGVWNNLTINYNDSVFLNVENKTNIEILCGGHGLCIEFDVCDCDEHYWGNSVCNITSCGDIQSNTSEVCSSHGDCLLYDVCRCENSQYYSGDDCEIWYCYEILQSDAENVCSGHGECVDTDDCECSSSTYKGDKCSEWVCFNISVLDNDVCNQHGFCLDNDVCWCDQGYSSSSIDSPCDEWYCGEYIFDSSQVCQERGECVSSHKCECYNSYEGSQCESWSCGLEYTNTYTCSGNGICESPEVCRCSFGYSGKLCENNDMYTTIMVPVLSVASIIFFILVTCVILAIVCCCICCVCIFVTALCILGLATLNLRFRVKKFKKLKNFDILLKEQELEEDESIAHIRIDRSLFEIPMEEIKLIKILGEGGSSSIVYQAKWNDQNVAFKCFKTRFVCSSQDSFDEFEREISVMASVHHPYIIRCFGCSLEPPRVGILMEFCSNGDLEDFFLAYKKKHNGMKMYPLKEKIRISSETCSACSYLHSRNIIHRDLKLQNVLVDDKESSKLMDFGLSRIVERMSIIKTKNVGTSIYMAPEIVLSTKYDEKVDVFSFGMMLYCIVTERYFPFKSDQNIEMKMAHDPHFRPELAHVEIGWISELIAKCWSHDKSIRPSMSELTKLFKERMAVSASTWEDDEEKTITTLPTTRTRKEMESSSSSAEEKNSSSSSSEEEKNSNDDWDMETFRSKYKEMKEKYRMSQKEVKKKGKKLKKLQEKISELGID